jgi:hypothetical protein
MWTLQLIQWKTVINLIKIENYVQQFRGACLIKRGSLLVVLAFTLINIYSFVLFTKYYRKQYICKPCKYLIRLRRQTSILSYA